MSRVEEATGRKPNLKKDMPYIFGCSVLCLRDADDRGPIGTLERGRTYLARYLGVHGAGHVVEKQDTGAIVYPSHCVPLNEHEMVRDSLPAGAALHSIETQTIGSEFPALASPPQPRVPASSPAPRVLPIAQEHYPTGTRLEVHYKVNGKSSWFAATVVHSRSSKRADGCTRSRGTMRDGRRMIDGS